MRMVVARDGLNSMGRPRWSSGVLAVFAGNGEEACGGEALVERVGKRIADPPQGWLSRAIIEGQNQDDSATRIGCLCRLGDSGDAAE